MTGSIVRKFNERELAVIERNLAMERPPREPKGPWLGSLIVGVLSGGLAYFYWGTAAGTLFAGLCLLCLLVAAYLSAENVKWRKVRLEVELMLREALDEGRVEVYTVEARGVVVEIDEHGPTVYYFDIGENRILRLVIGSVHWPAADPGDGHALYVEPGCDAWPNDRFEIVRTAAGGLWAGVFCLGEKLDPLRQINIVEEAPIAGKCDSPVAIFAGSLESVSGSSIEMWR